MLQNPVVLETDAAAPTNYCEVPLIVFTLDLIFEIPDKVFFFFKLTVKRRFRGDFISLSPSFILLLIQTEAR